MSEELSSNQPDRIDSLLDSNTQEVYNKIRQKCHNTISECNTINNDNLRSQMYDSYNHFLNEVNDLKKTCEYPDIKNQSTEELINFLSIMEPELDEVIKESFTEHQIDGKVFLKLKEHDLDDLGIKKISHRIILRDYVNKFKRMMKTKRKILKQRELEQKMIEQNLKAQEANLKDGQSPSSQNSVKIKKDITENNMRKNSNEKIKKLSSLKTLEINSLDFNGSLHQIKRDTGMKVNSGVSIDTDQGIDLIFSNSKKQLSQHQSLDIWFNFNKTSSQICSGDRFYSLHDIEDTNANKITESEGSLLSNVSMIPHCQDSNRSLNFRASSSSSSSQDSSNEDSDAGVYYYHNKQNQSMRLKLDSNFTMRKFEIKKDDLDIRNNWESIGHGEYGKVYKTRLYSSTDVAVKIFDNNKIKNQTIVNIMEEAELLLSLRFPNIILCMGWCMHSNLLMLVFEYMTQGSLFKILHCDKVNLSLLVKLNILCKIANGMTHLHSRDILHCDLKSSNILLADNFQTVKVCDLGMSFLKNKLRKKNNKWNSLSHYSAPEILRGEKFENAADVYSFGMIIWEMLTGSKPYQDISKSHLVGIVGYDCNHKLQLESSQYESQSLYKLMLRTLDRDPKKRPTFKEISRRLNKILENRRKQLSQKKQLQYLFSCNDTQDEEQSY
jgi:tRNA A-37 threonylcarbamoyl transferase component Bud32